MLASLDPTAGVASGWDPQPGDDEEALLVTATDVFVGGRFLGFDGQTQSQIARLPIDLTVSAEAAAGPTRSVLSFVGPNPTRGDVQIHYSIAREGKVRLELHDVTGRVVATLADRALAPGRYVASWNGADRHQRRVAPGVYLIRLTAPDGVAMRKITAVR